MRARVVAAEARRKAGAPAGPPLPLRRGPHLHTLQLSARLLPSWAPAWKACDCQARDDVHTKPQPQLSILMVLPLLLVAAGFMSQQFHSMQPLSSAAGPCTAAAVESPPPQDAAGTAAAAQQAQQAQLPPLTVDARGVGWKVVAPLSLGPPTMTSPIPSRRPPVPAMFCFATSSPVFCLLPFPGSIFPRAAALGADHGFMCHQRFLVRTRASCRQLGAITAERHATARRVHATARLSEGWRLTPAIQSTSARG